MLRAIRKNSLLLGAFAAATAALIAITFEQTKTRISDAEKIAAQKALFEIIPQEHHDNDLLADVISLSGKDNNSFGLSDPVKIHVAKRHQQLTAFIIPATAKDGYSGEIKMIIGVNIDGSVAGVRVLGHKETPGLGDKVELNKSPWILSFNGKSLLAPALAKWGVKKDGGDFDQFTGATITPRAVVKEVRAVLEFVEKNRSALLELANAEKASN